MRIVRFLQDSATLPRLLIAAFAMFAMRYAVMPWLGAGALESAGAGPLDLMFAYSPAQAHAALEGFGTAGRAAYRMFLLTADLVYPVTYTLCIAWGLALLMRGTAMADARWPLLLPIATFAFDMAENTGIVTMLGLFPDEPQWLALMTSACTTLKWIAAGASLALLFGLLLLRLYRLMRGANRASKGEK